MSGRYDGNMTYSTDDLISIARALADIQRGFQKATKRNQKVDVRIDRVPVFLRGTLAGHAVRDADGDLAFQPEFGYSEPAVTRAVEIAEEREQVVENDPEGETEVIIVPGGEIDETKPFGGILDPLADNKD